MAIQQRQPSQPQHFYIGDDDTKRKAVKLGAQMAAMLAERLRVNKQTTGGRRPSQRALPPVKKTLPTNTSQRAIGPALVA